MKRSLVIISLLVMGFQASAFSQQVPPLVAAQGYADTVLINGKIVTLDDRSDVPNTPGTIVEAMAIKGKKIMDLGTPDPRKSTLSRRDPNQDK